MDVLTAAEQRERETYLARTTASAALFARARAVMPGGDTRTGTFHAPYPLFIAEGQGCELVDADGHRYLDTLYNFTSLIHGHAFPPVVDAITAQAVKGTVHGSANALQVALAEVLRARVPSVERLRFCNSGTEATLFALRAAKAFTGRVKIMKMEGGYHGSHDQVAVAMAPPYDSRPAGLSPGALSEVILGRFNDLDRTASLIRQHRDELAAVIVEPVMGAGGSIPASAEFLRGLRAVTEECGILLILDEIITFRLGYGGMQEHLGIRPDLTAFGKIIGGGLPIGAFGGRADVMATYDPTRPGAIVHSGTYNGNAATMAAGIATLELFDRAAVAALNAAGDGLRARLNGIIGSHGVEAEVVGFGSTMQLHFAKGPITSPAQTHAGNRAAQAAMHLSLLNRGVFTASRQMYVLSTAMNEATLADFAAHFDAALGPIAAALRTLEPAGSAR